LGQDDHHLAVAHIVSQADYRTLPVRDWVRQAHTTSEHDSGLSIRETDFTDDPVTIVLQRLSKADYWRCVARGVMRAIFILRVRSSLVLSLLAAARL